MAQAFLVSAREMSPPFVVGISGHSKAGKSTLAKGLCKRLCKDGVVKETRLSTRDRVDRYLNTDGSRLCIIGQDDFFLPERFVDGHWDRPESLDHDKILDQLRFEIDDASVECIILEGFKLFHDDRMVQQMNLLLWLDAGYDLARQRWLKKRKKNESTDEHFKNEVWDNHMLYLIDVVNKIAQGKAKMHFITANQHPDCVLKEALQKIVGVSNLTACALPAKRSRPTYANAGMEYAGRVRKCSKIGIEFEDGACSVNIGQASASDVQVTSQQTSRSNREDLQLEPQVFKCANPNCWYTTANTQASGGYCCGKCHLRDTTGKKYHKNHYAECLKQTAPKDAQIAAPTPPAEAYNL